MLLSAGTVDAASRNRENSSDWEDIFNLLWIRLRYTLTVSVETSSKGAIALVE